MKAPVILSTLFGIIIIFALLFSKEEQKPAKEKPRQKTQKLIEEIAKSEARLQAHCCYTAGNEPRLSMVMKTNKQKHPKDIELRTLLRLLS